MGRDSGKCLHQLEMLHQLWVCGQPYIPLVVTEAASDPTEAANTQQRFVYMQRCRGSKPATSLRSQFLATLLK